MQPKWRGWKTTQNHNERKKSRSLRLTYTANPVRMLVCACIGRVLICFYSELDRAIHAHTCTRPDEKKKNVIAAILNWEKWWSGLCTVLDSIIQQPSRNRRSLRFSHLSLALKAASHYARLRHCQCIGVDIIMDFVAIRDCCCCCCCYCKIAVYLGARYRSLFLASHLSRSAYCSAAHTCRWHLEGKCFNWIFFS